MRILVLGGTWFLGRHFAELAAAAGHEVTVFHRGRSPAPGDVRVILGDRTRSADLQTLAEAGPWDAVVDPSGMAAAEVAASAFALARAAARYLFVSTVNVYQGWPTEPLDDTSAVRAPAGSPGKTRIDRYGREKAGAEHAVTAAFAGRAVILRPGVILGPGEYKGRLPWWLRRTARGGRMLAPGDPGRPIQPVDVRDVAAFALRCVENGLSGSFNVTAPLGHATFGSLLEACVEVTGGVAELVWVPDVFLARHGVAEWRELPMWRTHVGTWRIRSDRAAAAGLTCRPLSATVADTWEWLNGGGVPYATGTPAERAASEIGLAPDKETRLLELLASGSPVIPSGVAPADV